MILSNNLRFDTIWMIRGKIQIGLKNIQYIWREIQFYITFDVLPYQKSSKILDGGLIFY